MSKTTYSEKLRDPRWQRKRLEIMQRDNFTCQKCESTEKTLNVHHCYYETGNEPWEYPSASLVTLCFDCHDEETFNGKRSKQNLINALSSGGVLWEGFDELAENIYSSKIPPQIVVRLWLAAIKLYLNGGKNG